MKKLYLNALLFVFLFTFSCSDDPGITSPSGDCRVSKIIYEGKGDQFEQSFTYNADGLLIEYTIPNLGATEKICKAVLAYDDQQRLISIIDMDGNEVSFELHYTYKTPYILEGSFKDYFLDYAGTLMLYYNTEYQLDSARWIYNDIDHSTNDTTASQISYENGNIVSGIVADDPCCSFFTVSDVSYDNGINPHYLLKKATNNLGLVDINDRFPTASSIASVNNRLKYKWTWASRGFPGDPQTSIQWINNNELFYEYYESSPYIKIMRSSTNDVQNSGTTTFIYEACK